VSKSAPKAPDYAGAAREQAESSREVTEQQTWANRPTINTPFGSQSWEVSPQYDPATGQTLNTWTQNTTLTPESQAALNSQQRITAGRSGLAESMLGRAQSEYGQPMDWGKFSSLADTPGQENLVRDVGKADPFYNRAEDAIYGKWSNRQEPRMAREAEGLRTRLLNQGLNPGDEAYDNAMRDLSQNQNDAREQATMQSIIGAGSEAQRMQGMDISAGAFANNAANQAMGQNFQRAGYQNTLRQQQIAEEMQRRGFSLNEINAVLTGQQVGMPSMPGFNAANRSEGVQSLGAAQMQGQANLDSFNAEQQALQGLMSGVAGGAMMFSDRRLKKNIIFLYEKNGLRWYEYEYIWQDGKRSVGVMADEVVDKLPDAVWTHPSGYMMVDYGRIS
jgi:hypothetical protein